MKCDACPLLFCDFVSPECRLTIAEIIAYRPDLLKTPSRFVKYRESNNAACRRYRKENRPRRLQTERQWRARHREAINKHKRQWRAEAKRSDPVKYEEQLRERRRRRYAERTHGK